jgi:hypothetical protein
MTYDPNDEWDRYMTRYSGYTPATLESFIENGSATYDADSGTYTVRCDHFGHEADGCAGTFTVGLSPEFA